jgi:hypothetical protein
MTPDQKDAVVRQLDAWDPASGQDLPDAVAVALDADPELRARFDARFAAPSPAQLGEPTLVPDTLPERVLPAPRSRRTWPLFAAGSGGVLALAASALLVVGGLATFSARTMDESVVVAEPPVARPALNPDAGEGARGRREEGKVGKGSIYRREIDPEVAREAGVILDTEAQSQLKFDGVPRPVGRPERAREGGRHRGPLRGPRRVPVPLDPRAAAVDVLDRRRPGLVHLGPRPAPRRVPARPVVGADRGVRERARLRRAPARVRSVRGAVRGLALAVLRPRARADHRRRARPRDAQARAPDVPRRHVGLDAGPGPPRAREGVPRAPRGPPDARGHRRHRHLRRFGGGGAAAHQRSEARRREVGARPARGRRVHGDGPGHRARLRARAPDPAQGRGEPRDHRERRRRERGCGGHRRPVGGHPRLRARRHHAHHARVRAGQLPGTPGWSSSRTTGTGTTSTSTRSTRRATCSWTSSRPRSRSWPAT